MKWLPLLLAMTATAFPAEARDYRVVTFGTSITARGGWQQALGQSLGQCLKQPVEVLAIGGPGQASDWGLTNVDRVKALQPDLVIMEFAINDADLRHWMGLDESRRNTVALIRQIREIKPGPRVVLMTTNPVTGWKRLLRPRLNQYYAQYRKISQVYRLPLIDVAAGWQELPLSLRSGALPDGVHPRPDILSRVILAQSKRIVKCR